MKAKRKGTQKGKARTIAPAVETVVVPQLMPNLTPDLMDEKHAATYITMSVAYLRAGRSIGVTGGTTPHPPYLKLGRTIRYQRSDLDAWLASRRVTPTVQPLERGNASPAA